MSAILALLLVATLVDPRLDEPLRLLAEVQDAAGEPIGAEYAQMPDELGLSLIVASVPTGAGAAYQPQRRVLTVATPLLDEDPRVVAVALVHELQHASDFHLMADGRLDRDCQELEVRAFEAQAKVTRAFWPDELPSGTDWERGLSMTVQAYEAGGADGLRAMVGAIPGYQAEQCQD